jgi:hypothetical protein
MDIQTIAQDYPILLEQILAKATGQLGEYLVSEALRSRGYKTQFTKNDEQLDLHVIAPDGRAFTVEVKTGRTRSQWFVRKRPWRSEFWFFVHAPKSENFVPDPGSVGFSILTLDEVQKVWDANPWNIKNPENGDIRPNHMPEHARDAWHKLG